ncbi:ATP synthase F1 subunit gamma [Thermicanus aegyptius]|uniref:ATP synthase F1 subunit gamma n=1 Tax=Thermicanus aegyptius TaxID=94009 RepID=UPI0003FA9ED8|nr:ATP synthase F1 subunit gamma [Thermicanus aegyptius]
MARGLRELRARIRSNKNIRQITKAMEMVSASRFRRAQERAEHSKPYAEKIREVIMRIASGTEGVTHPMLERRPVKKTGYLLITADRGLAGGYNANLIRVLQRELKEKHAGKEEYFLLTVGRKGRDFFGKRGYPILEETVGLSDFPTFSDTKRIVQQAVRYFEDGTYDELYLVYNQFVNAMTQRPRMVRLLPLIVSGEEKGQGEAEVQYEYEPSPEAVLSELLPRYAETLIFSAILEAKAGEHAARMTAMKSATDNATELIDHYTLQLNRARQAAITQEISEIVAGANAL